MTQATKQDYNDWSNRATWNVSLWLNNDEGTYRSLHNRFQRSREQTVSAYKAIIQGYCNEIWPDGKTPDGCLLSEVNWLEIAKSERE